MQPLQRPSPLATDADASTPTMLRSHGRYPYSPIATRPGGAWPNGTGLAVYVALNLEHYAWGAGLVEDLVPGIPKPDVLNNSWREYGNRVGAWRLLELMQSLALPTTLLINSELYAACPSLIAAFRAHGAEIASHGRTNSEHQADLPESEERALIEQVTRTVAQHEGRAPAGWLSPWIAETERTPDLLHEAGYRYVLDWCMDDQPVWMTTRTGRILAVPYPQELNDSAAIIGRQVGAREFAQMVTDQFDEMLEQSLRQPLVMGIALHAMIAGQPFRLRALRQALQHIASQRERCWLTTAGAIAEAAAGPTPACS
jgi:peptidoglycan/xylan/chitin deacetylase (PgdA/CDA1 family)